MLYHSVSKKQLQQQNLSINRITLINCSITSKYYQVLDIGTQKFLVLKFHNNVNPHLLKKISIIFIDIIDSKYKIITQCKCKCKCTLLI